MDYATKNSGRLREVIRDCVYEDALLSRDVSRGNEGFLKVDAGHLACVFAVEFQGLAERYAKAFHQLLAGPFLAVHARYFLDPADPPIVLLFYYSDVIIFHRPILARLDA